MKYFGVQLQFHYMKTYLIFILNMMRKLYSENLLRIEGNVDLLLLFFSSIFYYYILIVIVVKYAETRQSKIIIQYNENNIHDK